MRTLSPVVALAVVLASAQGRDARADPKDECIAASEQGQRLKLVARLLEARDLFQRCTRSECPVLVREDCGRWMAEALTKLPSVVVGARDAEGRDVVSARLLIDRVVTTERLDGRPISIDPGVHSFRIEALDTGTSVEQDVVVREAEVDRPVTFVFAAKKPAVILSAPPAQPDARHSLSPLAWVFGGVGLAALGTSLGLYLSVLTDFNHLQSTCGHRCTTDEVTPLETRYTTSQVSLGAGVLSLGTAAYFLLARPRRQVDRATTSAHFDIVPLKGGCSAGLAAHF